MTANVAPNRAARRANGKAKVADDVLELDINSLTVDELDEIETLSGLPFSQFGDPEKPQAKMLRIIGYIVKKRENPEFTIEMAGKLKVQIADEPGPTRAAGKS